MKRLPDIPNISNKHYLKLLHITRFSSPPLCFVTIPFSSFLDNEEKLNLEGKAFVEDPKNADLFYDSPRNEKKRHIEDHPAHPPVDAVVKKKAKTADIEVRRQIIQVL